MNKLELYAQQNELGEVVISEVPFDNGKVEKVGAVEFEDAMDETEKAQAIEMLREFLVQSFDR